MGSLAVFPPEPEGCVSVFGLTVSAGRPCASRGFWPRGFFCVSAGADGAAPGNNRFPFSIGSYENPRGAQVSRPPGRPLGFTVFTDSYDPFPISAHILAADCPLSGFFSAAGGPLQQMELSHQGDLLLHALNGVDEADEPACGQEEAPRDLNDPANQGHPSGWAADGCSGCPASAATSCCGRNKRRESERK